MTHVKIRCDGCDLVRSSRNVIQYKGKMKCSQCRSKEKNNRLLESIQTKGRLKFSKEQALNRIYPVKVYSNNHKMPYCVLHVPLILAGRKVKLIEVEEEE